LQSPLDWIGLQLIREFCYLGDTIGVGGGALEAYKARVRSASVKFRVLAPVLTSREVA